MPTSDLVTLLRRADQIRARYHALEQRHHGSVWTVEEDALAFLTDAGLVGRLTMAQQQRWPKGGSECELVWWTHAEGYAVSMEELLQDRLSPIELGGRGGEGPHSTPVYRVRWAVSILRAIVSQRGEFDTPFYS